ncbi:MAG: response regulator [Pseudomonadota bacterium]
MNATVQKARVLFVDDEPRILTSMRMLFRGSYDTFFAESGQQGIELLKTQPVDVIVSDQRMPGMSGFEFLRAARDINPHAMRILLTGYSDLNAIVGSVNEGEIFRFVNKPWANDVLSSTVANAVQAARASLQVSLQPEPFADTLPMAGVAIPAAPAVLVLDDDPQVAPRVQASLGTAFRVFGARSMEDAVDCLEREHIGVVISDTRVQNQPVVSLIGLLKQHQPQLVTVILTERADAGTAIELINQGQIYRLLTKPVQEVTCRIMVNSAHKHHQHLARNPELHQRYEVEKPAAPAPGAPPPPTLRLMDRVRALRSWVTGTR